jgi:hypothetical protein
MDSLFKSPVLKYGSLATLQVLSEERKKELTTLFTQAREPLRPLLYFRSPHHYQPHPSVPSLAASTFTFGALLWRYRKFNFLNFSSMKLSSLILVHCWLPHSLG